MATSTSKAKKARASAKNEEVIGRNVAQLKKVSIVLAVILVLLVLFDFTPFGGSIRFYAKWIECGNRPMTISGSGYLNAGVSHYYPAPVISLTRGSNRPYFCTALEAEQAGYSANEHVYSFPELNKLRDVQR